MSLTDIRSGLVIFTARENNMPQIFFLILRMAVFTLLCSNEAEVESRQRHNTNTTALLSS